MLKLTLIWGSVAALSALLYVMPSHEGDGQCFAGRMIADSKQAVRSVLRDPASASFEEVKERGGNVTGRVRAQNGFGAYSVENFAVRFECVNGTPVVVGLSMN